MTKEELTKLLSDAHMRGQKDGFNMACDQLIVAIQEYKKHMTDIFKIEYELND